METIYIIGFIAVFALGFACGRWSNMGANRATDDIFGAPAQRTQTPHATVPKKQSAKPLEKAPSPAPNMSKPSLLSPIDRLWVSLGKTDELPNYDISDEDRALIISLIRQGHAGPAKLVFKQVSHLRGQALAAAYLDFVKKVYRPRMF